MNFSSLPPQAVYAIKTELGLLAPDPSIKQTTLVGYWGTLGLSLMGHATLASLVSALRRHSARYHSDLGFEISEEELGSLATKFHKTAIKPTAGKLLTDRERDVLMELVTTKKNSKEIGEELCIACGTVDGHQLRISDKTGIRGRDNLRRAYVAGKLRPWLK